MEDSIVNEFFDRDLFFAKQARMKLQLRTEADWDVYDPEMQVELFQCREPDTSLLTKVARGKPFNVTLRAPDTQLLRVQSDPAFLTGGPGTLLFSDAKDRPLGALKRKFLDVGFGKSYRFFAPGSKTPLFELKYRNKFRHHVISLDRAPVAEVRLKKWKGDYATYFKNGFEQAIALAPGSLDDSLRRRVVVGVCFCMNHLIK